MRQIKMIIDIIAKLVLKRDNMEFNIYNESNSIEIHKLYERLINLINQLKLNEAEDILFEEVDNKDLNYMKVAIDFYERISKLSDEELEIGKFTREEIKLGIEDILKIYNIKLPFFD